MPVMIGQIPQVSALCETSAPRLDGDPDWAAFRVVQTWTAQVPPEDVTFMGVDLGHAVRRAVMPAVAAAIRETAFPAAAARSHEFVRGWGLDRKPGAARNLVEAARRTLPKALDLAGGYRLGAQARRARNTGRPRLLVKAAGRLRPLLDSFGSSPEAEIVLLGRFGKQPAPYPSVPLHPESAPDRVTMARFRNALAAGLAAEGLDLNAQDRNGILAEARWEAGRIKAIHRVLDRLRPDALLLHDDTSPEGLTLALVGTARGLPVLTLAHGLDCQRFYLDPVYASHKLVWGPARAARLHGTAEALGAVSGQVRVTGNPGHDGLSVPAAPATQGTGWLWVTRPHTPRKCILPGRCAVEGADILDALLRALAAHPAATLTIKPHPNDYARVYEAQIARAGLGDRARVSHSPLAQLLPAARVVISEDSTAALDACLAGKPLVYSHFAPTPPVLPLEVYNAALPGRDPDSLTQSLARLDAGDNTLSARLFEGQARFIAAEAGPLDGCASARVRDVISEVLWQSRCR